MKILVISLLSVLLLVLAFAAGRLYESFRPLLRETVMEEVLKNVKGFSESYKKGIENDSHISALLMLAVLHELDSGNTNRIRVEAIKVLADYYANNPELPKGLAEESASVKNIILNYAKTCPELKQQLGKATNSLGSQTKTKDVQPPAAK